MEEEEGQQTQKKELTQEQKILQTTLKYLEQIKYNNKAAPSHKRKILEVKKNNDIITFIDNNQRKFFSSTKS